MSRKNMTPAIAYLRTSSATNVGADKDSDKRQRHAIEAFAKHAGYELVGEYFDAAVSGADPIEGRPGFKALLERIVSNGVNTVIVEDASRFARTLMVQEAGIAMLVGLGVQVMTSRGDDLTDSDDEMRVAMRQIVGVFSQLEKTRLVKKLKAARDRKRVHGKVEGRKSHAEKRPNVVLEAKRLYRANPRTGERRSLREISAELEKLGFLNEWGRPYHAQSIRRMVEGERPARAEKDSPNPITRWAGDYRK
jgi:DNA invertase Pin-like site-specific DNA recombinase